MPKAFLSTIVCVALTLSLDAQEKITITGNNILLRSKPAATAAPAVFVNDFETDLQSMVLDPGTIQSMTILKDASATALYGSKGVNGVILIKTKPGTEFYTISDFVNAEKNTNVQQIKLNENVLPDMKKLLIEKTALKQTSLSTAFSLDETCKAVRSDILVIMTGSGN